MAYERKLEDFLITDRVQIKNFPKDFSRIVETNIRKYDHRKITKKVSLGDDIFGKVVGFKEHTGRIMVWLEDSKHGTYIGFRKKDIKIVERSVGAISFEQIGEIGAEAYGIVYGEDK